MKRYNVTFIVPSTGLHANVVYEAVSEERLRKAFNKGKIVKIEEQDGEGK